MNRPTAARWVGVPAFLVLVLVCWPAIRVAIDRVRYPRSSFGALIESSTGHAVDTIHGTATKDLVGLPDTTVQIRWTRGGLDTLYALAIRDRLFDLPEPHPISTPQMIQPAFDAHVRLTAGSRSRDFRWNSGDRPTEASMGEWMRLFRFARTLDSMAVHQPNYEALPPAKGGYM